jgi:CRP-like cAMP-binding protein
MTMLATHASSQPKPSNKLLARLPDDDYRRLAPLLDTVRLPGKTVLHSPGAPIQRVYFPQGGICSTTCLMADGEVVDVAIIGNDGIVGINAILRGDFALHETLVRIPNNAQALPVTAFWREMERGGAFYTVMTRYAQAFVAQLMQSIACNTLHPIEKRCARWLLDMHDRVGRAEFPLTQELLATMLGVRRASITVCASDLHHEGLIDYGRRRLVIRDRLGLETVSCECYATVKRYVAQLLP